MKAAWRSVLEQIFDVVVVGTGYAGFAAAVEARRAGRSVLMVGSRGDLVWESGRSFCPDPGTGDRQWADFVAEVERRGGGNDTWIDGAIAEVVATDLLIRSGAHVLYYAHPVDVETVGDQMMSLIVATKSGLRRVVGRRWVDATEAGVVVRIVDPEATPRAPRSAEVHLALQHADWSTVAGGDALQPTTWGTERLMRVAVTPGDPAWREEVVAALEHLKGRLGPSIADVSLSHLSFEPIGRYELGPKVTPSVGNLVMASPAGSDRACATLADRFRLGVDAAQKLAELPAAEPAPEVLTRPLPRVEPAVTVQADVCVVGAGTGGALAAVAAGKTGANVVCVEPQPFVGGVGTGGGIHSYWFGVPGGLQREVDRMTRDLMRRFHGGPLGDGPFNPWAKTIVLERLLREHGVTVLTDALLYDVERSGGRVVAASVATPSGVTRIEAWSYVDGTGDGDLAAAADAEFTFGREYDGLVSSFTQSSGALVDAGGRPRMTVVNFDSGFCDPTDPEDLTRARLASIQTYLADSYDTTTRPTYIAPQLGLRQGRQVVTDYVLTLDDQISARRFDDVIGYTGAHFENHTNDLEFGSDEALFWVWGNRQWLSRIGCELSYRNLVPRGLENVWLASRCFGVSQDAHNATRMQRDMQRIGEAAGLAAGLAAIRRETARELPYGELRGWLDRTGALGRRPHDTAPEFGTADDRLTVDADLTAATALAALDRAEAGEAMWWLAHHEDLVRDELLTRLSAASDPEVSWFAALVVAMWGHPAAESRLVRAVETLEPGPDPGIAPGWTVYDNQIVPRWLCAVAMLRRCGTDACLPALEGLLDAPAHGIDTLNTIAITIERLVLRGAVPADERGRVEQLLDRILEIPALGVVDVPVRALGRHSQEAFHGSTAPASAERPAPSISDDLRARATQDFAWQRHLAVAWARRALGLPPPYATADLARDERAYVRRAFARVTQQLAMERNVT